MPKMGDEDKELPLAPQSLAGMAFSFCRVAMNLRYLIAVVDTIVLWLAHYTLAALNATR
jgi:hypothetical protein